MDLQMFQKHAKRTMPASLSPSSLLDNMALGIAGELGEVIEATTFPNPTRPEQIRNEAGDVCWYIVNLCTLLSLDWTTLLTNTSFVRSKIAIYLLNAAMYSGRIADTIKKHTGQQHELDVPAIQTALEKLLSCLLAILDYYNLELEEVCEFNHLKLMKRYPFGFEKDRSISREI